MCLKKNNTASDMIGCKPPLNVTSCDSNFSTNITNSLENIVNLTGSAVSSDPSLNEEQNLDTNEPQESPNLITYSVFSSLCVIINLRVFYIVNVTSKRKNRPANILVAHLSSVVIGYKFLVYLKVLGKIHLFNLAAPGLCNVFAFLRNCVYNVFTLNIGAIVWVLRKNNALDLDRNIANQAMRLMWIITIVSNLPSSFMTEYVKNPVSNLAKCRQIHLLGTPVATIAYETMRLILFNGFVCVYLIRVSRTTGRFLRIFKGVNVTKTTKQIQFVHLHTILLILIWFPNGVFVYLYKILTRFDWTPDYIKDFTAPLYLSYFVYVLCPVSYVFLLEKMPVVKFLVPCYQVSSLPQLQINLENIEQDEPPPFGWRVDPILKQQSSKPQKEKSVTWSKKAGVNIIENPINVDEIERSLLTTVGLTPPSSTPWSVSEISFHGLSETSTYSHNSSIPSVMTPTTARLLQYIEVEVHEEPESIDTEEEMFKMQHHSETLV